MPQQHIDALMKRQNGMNNKKPNDAAKVPLMYLDSSSDGKAILTFRSLFLVEMILHHKHTANSTSKPKE
jgi:hypothetical protein